MGTKPISELSHPRQRGEAVGGRGRGVWLSCDNIEIRIEVIIVQRFPADSLGFGFQLSTYVCVCECNSCGTYD